MCMILTTEPAEIVTPEPIRQGPAMITSSPTFTCMKMFISKLWSGHGRGNVNRHTSSPIFVRNARRVVDVCVCGVHFCRSLSYRTSKTSKTSFEHGRENMWRQWFPGVSVFSSSKNGVRQRTYDYRMITLPDWTNALNDFFTSFRSKDLYTIALYAGSILLIL